MDWQPVMDCQSILGKTMIPTLLAFAFPTFVLSVALYYLLLRPRINNSFLGYRTEYSLRNQIIWNRAQFLFGKQLLIGGIVAAFFGYGFLSVTNLLLKVVLIVMQLFVVSVCGMFTDFMLRKEFKER
jgi:uncharacterized membrane protein